MYPEYGHCSKPPLRSKSTVLILGPLSPTVGGITTFINGILESDLKWKYTLITFGTERPTFGIIREVGDYTLLFRVGLTCLAKSALSTISHLLMFPLVLIMNRPDIVHINTASYWSFWENAGYILMSKALFKKTLFHIHGGGFAGFYKRSNILARFTIRKILCLPDKLVVLSSTWKKFFEDLVPKDKIAVVDNFVDSSLFSGINKRWDLAPDARENKLRVLFIGGAGAKGKGFYDVIKAIPLVVRCYENILFIFVACANIKKLDSVCDQKEISHHAKFLDYVHGNNKIKILEESDIFVLPSYFEGLPIAMLEAMAACLPIIGTPVGAIPEIIEDGKNGFLIKTGDYNALAEKIVMLAQDKKLRHEMGKNNYEKIMKKYDKSLVIRKLEGEYERLKLRNKGYSKATD